MDSSTALGSLPWDNAPRYLLRDRDGIYGEKSVNGEMDGIPEVLAAPRITMAKRLRGALDRVHSTGVLVARHCLP
jgi:hypothetical protein